MIRTTVMTAALLGAAVLISGTIAHAGTITTAVQTVSVPSRSTDYNASAAFEKFDATLGTLTSVAYSIAGSVTGLIQIENVDASAKTVRSSLNATLSLQRPDGSTLTFTLPVAGFVDALSAFDGSEDYAGTSGVSHTNIRASNSSGTVTSTAASDLALFSGAGQTITLTILADGNSNVNASGNIDSRIRTSAESVATVFYTYETLSLSATTVPEPASLVIVGASVMGLSLVRRRSRS